MGLNDNITDNSYYWFPGVAQNPKTGFYQFTTLDNIINGFMIQYVGEGKIINKVHRTDVQFCAMRAIQEFSYDILRSFKSQEIRVPQTLRMALPKDYVNYIKLTRVDSSGIERILYPTRDTSNPFPVRQLDPDETGYNVLGDTLIVEDESLVEQGGIGDIGTFASGSLGSGAANTPIGVDPFGSDALVNFNNQPGDSSTDIDLDAYGRRYGLDPERAQNNGTFYIDYRTNFIHFGSSLAGETIILKYVSDGLGTDEEMVVHKFCVEAVYKWVAYCILSNKTNIPEYVIQRFKKEKFAEGRKAKIRLSNIKIEEFTQILKGLSKPIK